MKRLSLILFAAVSVAELISIIIGNEMLHLIAKPLIVPTLCAHYMSAVGNQQRSKQLLLALFFSWAGDVLLMFQEIGGSFFIFGLIAFLISHVFYIFTYKYHQWETSENALYGVQKVRLSFPIVLAGTGLFVVLYPSLGDLRFPVALYALILVMMVLNALFRYGRTSTVSFWLVFGGAVLFMISDSVLAINKFLQPVEMGNLWVMTTYIAAQFLIVRGLLRH